jgi:hypothetical protein
LDNIGRAGGATVGQLRALINLIEKLADVTKKYRIGLDTDMSAPDMVKIVKRLEEAKGPAASKLVLRPLRMVKVDSEESEEAFENRMLNSDIRSDDNEATDWVKVYSRYVSLRESGSTLTEGCDPD